MSSRIDYSNPERAFEQLTGIKRSSIQGGQQPQRDPNLEKLQQRLAEVDRKIASNEAKIKDSAIYRGVTWVGDKLPGIDSFREDLADERESILANIQDIERSRQRIQETGTGEGGFGAAFKRGVGNLRSTIGGLGAMVGDVEADDIQDIQAGRQIAREAPRSAEEQAVYEEFQAADGWMESARTLFTNPRLIANLAIESLPSSALSLAGNVVGTVGGGVAGALASPAGAATGAVVGGSIGSGLGSFATEYGNAMLDTFVNNGVNIDDPEQLKAALGDPDLMSEARERGVKRGIAVGAFDALSAGIAGKLGIRVGGGIIGDTATATTGRKVAGAVAGSAAELGAQGTLGGAGEAAGQIATEGRITSPQDVLAEFAGEIPGGAVESLIGVARTAIGNREQAPANQREDTDLMGALQAYTSQREPSGPTPQLEDQNAVAMRDMGTMRVGGLNLTADQVLEFASNNTNNPRIADIMSQPVADTTKVEQVARIINAEQAARVEPEAMRRISGLVGGTTPVSTARQSIQDELAKIGDEVVNESQTLSAIRDTVNSNAKGKEFVSGLRSITGNYSPPSSQGQTFVARPERGGEGSVIMTPDQTAEEAQREREAQQAFRMAERRQQRFDQATGQGTQREDIRPGAPEPQAQFFLGDAYGDLAGTAATVVESASPGVYRIQYDSPTETDANGNPVTISEEVPALDLVGRVVRGTPRMTQELAGSVRKPRRGTGTDMNPRQSVDRTTTRAIAEAQQPQPPMVPPQEPNITMTGRQEQPFQYEAQPSLNAQEMPVQDNAAPEGTVESQAQVSGAPGATALPAPPRGLPAPEAPKRRTPPPPVTEREETAQKAPAKDTNLTEQDVAEEDMLDVEDHPRMVEHNQRYDDAIDRVQETENATDVRKLAKKLIREGVIDEDDYSEIDSRMKDVPTAERWDEGMMALEEAIDQQRDNVGYDIADEIRSEDPRYYSSRSDRVRGPRVKASEVVARTAPQQQTQQEPQEEAVDYESVINDRLDKIAERGAQGRVIAKRLRNLLKDKSLTANQLYYAIRMGEVFGRVLPKNAKIDILFVPSMKATNALAAAASGTTLGADVTGSYKPYEISQNGFRGLITMSLAEDMLSVSRENAAHEAFHVIQDMLRAYDPEMFSAINNYFKDGMRIDELDPSILRKLKSLTLDGNRSVYQSLVDDFGDTPLGRFEAQAVAFGALVDAKDRGENMKGLKASISRFVDMLSSLRRGLRNILRKPGSEKLVTIAEVFEGYRTGEYQEDLEGLSAPLADGSVEEQYSARTKADPVRTQKAYKLFRVDARKPGQLFPLFVNANDPVPMGKWLDADVGPAAGNKVKSKLGPLAMRPGWHAGDLPIATHIGAKSKASLKAPDTRPDNQVWAEVEFAADRDWQQEANSRAKRNANGEIIANTAHITDQIPEDGFYRYKTNPNMTGNWLIGGSMKVTRILSDAEVEQINSAAGVSDLPRAEPFDTEKYGFNDGTQYSARRYNPDRGLDSAIENLKEDITQAGGEIVDAASIDELVSSDEIPVITVKDLVGKKIFPTISDRTAAAALYTGIDSSQTVAIPMLGGPNYPLRKSSQKSGVVWANRGGAVLTKKMNKVKEGANYMMVMMGSADMHQSNTTVNNAFFVTLEAYARDGRISGDNATALTEMIKTAPDADSRIKKYLEEFPGFDDAAALDSYIHRISFDARNRIMKILGSKAALDLGAPSLRPILEATREPSMAGHRWGDGVLVVELTGDGVVELGKDGTMAHPDFPLGMRGRVVGRLATPINYEVLWQDFIKQSKARTSERGKTPSEETARYDFQQSLPIVEVTQELADRIGDLDVPNIDSARQAQLAAQMISNNWRTSDQTKKDGGVSVQEFVDAINNSPAKTVLNEYTAKDVTADIKSGKMSVYQLGNDGQIFFALKKGDPQYAEDYGVDIPMIGKDEVMVTAVINNEQGARGIAAPAVMLKAIQEGATVLDCFAVKSKKFPNGFLPSLYKQFGFVKVAEVPFAPEYYSERKLADAVKYWKDSTPGYNPETDGYPPLVIMKWIGTNEERTGILDRYLRSGIEGLLEGRDFSPAAEAEAGLLGNGADAAGGAGTAAVSERTAGAEGTRAGSSVASRARQVVEAIAGLSDQQLTNLGLTKNDRLYARLKTAEAEQYSARTGGSMANRLAANRPLRPMPKFTDANVDEPTRLDDVIYNLQDKLIDVKRLQQNIEKSGKVIGKEANVYRAEELYHGRAAKRAKDFVSRELSPLIQDMKSKGVSLPDFDEYLHARHAKERNAQIRKVNPNMQDGGSGMTDAEADAYMQSLPNARRLQLEKLAKRVDSIVQETQKMMVAYGLETQDTINNWNSTYKAYVPLQREGFEEDIAGSGAQGLSVRGGSSRRAMGSSLGVVDVLANVAMQRERVITRGERNLVGNAMVKLALENPNDSFWFVIDPKSKSTAMAEQKLVAFGVDPVDAKEIVGLPTERFIDSRTGRLVVRANSRVGSQPNVLATRINGEDRYVVFNARNPRAARTVASLKNLDAAQIGAVLGVIGKATRYFAAINTQYNPAFGLYNLMRDVQGAAINLGNTPLANDKAKVISHVLTAGVGMYRDLRAERAGGTATSNWAKLAEEFELAGGKTGFRDMFRNSQERADSIERELDPTRLQKIGDTTVGPVFNWLSDFNESIENSVRLSAYKVARDKGLSIEESASIAKNITVNFNRKGAIGTQTGLIYAFFNASVQGTARMAEALTGPTGKKIIAGGLMLGVVQAVALAAAGFDEGEIPDWLKDKNLVIPTGGGKYIAIPMPLGYHAIPALSRRATEFFMSGNKSAVGEGIELMGLFADAFNPIGNGGTLAETLSPTVTDPIVQLEANRDFAGRPIYNENFNSLDPTPGPDRTRDGASIIGEYISQAIDTFTGGNGYVPGKFSPTGDQVDFAIGTVTGGAGRTVLNTISTVKAGVTGEDLPNYKIPFVGRMVGDKNEAAAVSGRFYENLKEVNGHQRTLKGMQEKGEDTAGYISQNPGARFADADAAFYEREVTKLKKERKEIMASGDKQELSRVTEELQQLMVEFNQRYMDAKKAE